MGPSPQPARAAPRHLRAYVPAARLVVPAGRGRRHGGVDRHGLGGNDDRRGAVSADGFPGRPERLRWGSVGDRAPHPQRHPGGAGADPGHRRVRAHRRPRCDGRSARDRDPLGRHPGQAHLRGHRIDRPRTGRGDTCSGRQRDRPAALGCGPAGVAGDRGLLALSLRDQPASRRRAGHRGCWRHRRAPGQHAHVPPLGAGRHGRSRRHRGHHHHRPSQWLAAAPDHRGQRRQAGSAERKSSPDCARPIPGWRPTARREPTVSSCGTA